MSCYLIATCQPGCSGMRSDGGIAFSSVCLFVCLSVCQHDNSWTARDITTKFSGHHRKGGQVRKWLCRGAQVVRNVSDVLVCFCAVDPMRQGGVLSAESVAALITAVVVVPLAVISLVVVARVCRRRHKQQQQQQQQQLQQPRTRPPPSAPQYPVTSMRITTGGDILQRPRAFTRRRILINLREVGCVREYSVSQKTSSLGFLTFSPNGWEFLVQILHDYFTFLCTLDYEFLFNYLQLWRSYATLSATNIICSNYQLSAETHAGWSHFMWHNFVTVGDNWIKNAL